MCFALDYEALLGLVNSCFSLGFYEDVLGLVNPKIEVQCLDSQFHLEVFEFMMILSSL